MRCRLSAIPHPPGLPGSFQDRVPVPFPQLAPLADHVPDLVRMLWRAQPLIGRGYITHPANRVEVVYVQHVVRLEHHPGDRLQLVIEDEHVGISTAVGLADAATYDVATAASGRGALI